MKQTWRWFGPDDSVSLADMRQAGVEGVVSALHYIAAGKVWPLEQIKQRQREISMYSDGSASGLSWDVVESLPVSEDIKRQTGDWRAHLDHYCDSLRNLAAAGIEVICYNFMPVLDWTRTDLAYRVEHGGTCMRFDLIDFAAFDLFIFERAEAPDDFPKEICEQARARFDNMSGDRKAELAANIAFGLPGGADKMSLDDLRREVSAYAGIDAARLRAHLIAFLEHVVPVAEELGLRLCCHPDDPPFPLLGLPRIMSCETDYAAIVSAVDSPANGITLCSGSLGARPDNDLAGMMERLGDKVHFLHLRNVARESSDIRGSFHEAEHLEGGTDMVALIAAVTREERRRATEGRKDAQIPMRPDHGQDILDDLTRKGQPGYPAIGRLKGLAELRGIMTALDHPVEGLNS
jgi:mannonate dehydratase